MSSKLKNTIVAVSAAAITQWAIANSTVGDILDTTQTWIDSTLSIPTDANNSDVILNLEDKDNPNAIFTWEENPYFKQIINTLKNDPDAMSVLEQIDIQNMQTPEDLSEKISNTLVEKKLQKIMNDIIKGVPVELTWASIASIITLLFLYLKRKNKERRLRNGLLEKRKQNLLGDWDVEYHQSVWKVNQKWKITFSLEWSEIVCHFTCDIKEYHKDRTTQKVKYSRSGPVKFHDHSVSIEYTTGVNWDWWEMIFQLSSDGNVTWGKSIDLITPPDTHYQIESTASFKDFKKIVEE